MLLGGEGFQSRSPLIFEATNDNKVHLGEREVLQRINSLGNREGE